MVSQRYQAVNYEFLAKKPLHHPAQSLSTLTRETVSGLTTAKMSNYMNGPIFLLSRAWVGPARARLVSFILQEVPHAQVFLVAISNSSKKFTKPNQNRGYKVSFIQLSTRSYQVGITNLKLQRGRDVKSQKDSKWIQRHIHSQPEDFQPCFDRTEQLSEINMAHFSN